MTGIGQTVPGLPPGAANRMSVQTRLKSASPIKPVRGENAPMAIISRSNASRGERAIVGRDLASAEVALAASGLRIRLTRLPPWGATRDIVFRLLLPHSL